MAGLGIANNFSNTSNDTHAWFVDYTESLLQ